jgi:glycerol-3-phosphate acyltransferase PlsX
VVTDGFSGNILLKTTEGVAKYMMGMLKGVFFKNLGTKLAAAIVRGGLKDMKKKLDFNEVGGTALLGISKPVIKAHGASKETGHLQRRPAGRQGGSVRHNRGYQGTISTP